MLRRPIIIKMVAGFLLILPIVGWTGGMSLAHGKWDQVWASADWQAVTLSLASLLAAFGVWRVQVWGYYSFFVFVSVVLAVDVAQLVNGTPRAAAWYVIDLLFAVLGVVLFRQREFYEPYFNPRVRWWERAERLSAVNLDAEFEIPGMTHQSQILDLSESGCFALVTPMIPVGKSVLIRLKFGGISFSGTARVVRHSEVPLGSGFLFTFMGWADRRALKRILLMLKSGKVPHDPLARKPKSEAAASESGIVAS